MHWRAGPTWKSRFSRTFKLRSGFGRCGTTPIRCRTCTACETTSAPPISAVPDVGFTRVVRMPIVVVLPAPFGPRSPKNSPCLISRSSDCKATTSAPRIAPGGVPGTETPGIGGGPNERPRFGAAGAGYTFRRERVSIAIIGLEDSLVILRSEATKDLLPLTSH